MDLLKKHYEKIVLLVMLLIFAALLLYLLDIIRSTGDITEDDLRLPTPKADYVRVNPELGIFNFKKLLATYDVATSDGKAVTIPLEWRATPPRDTVNKNFSTDLTLMYKAAHCAHCGRIVPSYYFHNLNCPLCGKELLEPKNPVKITPGGPEAIDPLLDSDRDGIPDVDEKKFGLDPKLASDAMDDMDKDGFPNLYEYEMKTDMRNPKSHPALDMALRVSGFEQTKLPVALKNVYSDGSLCQLDMTININGEDRIRSAFLGKGDKVELDGSTYTVEKITPRFVKREDGSGTNENVSTVRFVNGPDEIVMKVGADAYAPHEKVIFEYLFDQEKRLFLTGGEFTLGNARIGEVHYRVKSLDSTEKKSVLIGPKGKEIEIGSEYRIPKKYWPSVSEKTTETEDANRSVRPGRPGEAATRLELPNFELKQNKLVK